MKSQIDKKKMRTYKVLVQSLKRAKIILRKQVLDNKVSENMKELIRSTYNMDLELVPHGVPSLQRCRSGHLKLQSTLRQHPCRRCRQLPHAVVGSPSPSSRNHDQLVAAVQRHPYNVHMSGPFDYNKMPLAPIRCQVQVHEKTEKRGTWACNSVNGWSLVTLPEHYRTRC